MGIDTVVLYGRGDLGRTEAFSQTDFGISHRYRFGRDNKFQMVFDIDVLNIFNEANELSRDQSISLTDFDITDPSYGVITADEALLDNAFAIAMARFQKTGASGILSFINDEPNPTFNMTNSWQSPRSIRFGFRFIF